MKSSGAMGLHRVFGALHAKKVMHALAQMRQGNPPESRRATQGSPKGRRTGGGVFFGYFLLAVQKKVTSRRAAPGEVDVQCIWFGKFTYGAIGIAPYDLYDFLISTRSSRSGNRTITLHSGNVLQKIMRIESSTTLQSILRLLTSIDKSLTL